MRILLTGDKGFVGKETRRLLEEHKHQVIGYDALDGFEVRDINQFRKTVQENIPHRILHLAATARFSEADKDPIRAFDSNAIGTKNIADVAEENHIPVVYSSTGSVYMPVKKIPPITEEFPAQGNSVYACSKLLGEKYLQTHSMPWIILRYGHLYGAEKRFHGLIGGYVSAIQQGRAPTLFGGNQTNDFAYVKDVAKANLLALTASADKWNQIYNIGTGVEISAEDAGKAVCKAMGYDGPIEKKEIRLVDPERFVYDMSKAKHMLEFEADWSFDAGLKDMFDEIKKHG